MEVLRFTRFWNGPNLRATIFATLLKGHILGHALEIDDHADRATISHSKHPVAQLLLKIMYERVAQFGGHEFKNLGGCFCFC